MLLLCSPISLWGTTHRVKKGDTLWSIATNHKTTVSKLKVANGMTSDHIRLGQLLKLPSSSVTSTYIKPQSHRVKAGEHLSSIARRYGTSVPSILRINNISDPNKIQVGQTLKISNSVSRSSKGSSSIRRGSISSLKPVSRSVSSSKIKSYSSSKKYTIVIDPGHGGKDTGAVKYGLRESDLNLTVSLKVAAKLKALGYRVVMTRTSDRYLSLSSRAYIANKYPNSLFVSIHFNSATDRTAKGIETFYCSSKGKRLADLVQYGIKRRIGSTKDRKVKYRRFSVLRNTNNPAILTECGFMSNYTENRRMRSTWWKDQCADGIVEAIRRY